MPSVPFTSDAQRRLFCLVSPSLAAPAACGRPLRSAAPSGPAACTAACPSPAPPARCRASASWAPRAPRQLMRPPPPAPPTTWARPTTPGGYGAPPSDGGAQTPGRIRTSLTRIEIRQKKKTKTVVSPGLDRDVPVSETPRRLSPLLLPTPLPPHLCRAGLHHSLLSDLSCNYDNTRFAVVLVEKSLDSATNSSKTCTSENLTCYQLSTTCLPPALSICVTPIGITAKVTSRFQKSWHVTILLNYQGWFFNNSTILYAKI